MAMPMMIDASPLDHQYDEHSGYLFDGLLPMPATPQEHANDTVLIRDSSNGSPSTTNADETVPSFAGGARENKRETIASRAKRFIGRSIEIPKESNPPKRGKKDKAKTPVSAERRREQVLKAQRNHRQRTTGYIRELEKEVASYRMSQHRCHCHNDKLLFRVKKLETILHVHHIPIPYDDESECPTRPLPTEANPGFAHDSPPSSKEPEPEPVDPFTEAIRRSQQACVMPSLPSGSSATVAVDFRQFMDTGERVLPAMTEEEMSALITEDADFTPFLPSNLPAVCDIHLGDNNQFLTTQQAVDFVLTLERICFPHLDWNALVNPEEGSVKFAAGHAYVTATEILSQNKETLHKHLPHGAGSSVSEEGVRCVEVDMASIYKGSLHVDFGEDVTPLQIWANIDRINHSGYHKVCPEVVTHLQNAFAKLVKCNGFGATVNKQKVSSFLNLFFPGECYQASWCANQHTDHTPSGLMC